MATVAELDAKWEAQYQVVLTKRQELTSAQKAVALSPAYQNGTEAEKLALGQTGEVEAARLAFNAENQKLTALKKELDLAKEEEKKDAGYAEAKNSPPLNESSTFLSAETFEEFDKKLAASAEASAALYAGVADIPGLTGKTITENSLINNLTNGITPAQADNMLAADIVKNETSVKKILSSLGLTKIPQNVFDGLVSMQNQLGDVSYAYVGGSKVDLTSFYQNGEWDKAASFMAADERDRPRRIREAAMIVGNDYGPEVVEASIIRQGLDNANELIAKEKLNQQTGDAASTQQIYAVSTNYLNVTGKSVPRQNFPTAVIASDKELEKLVQRSAGPWPY